MTTQQSPAPQTGTVGLSETWQFLITLDDPFDRLHAAMYEMPLPAPTTRELYDGLLVVGRFDRGEIRELSGLAAWLDFLRDPYQDDEHLDEDDYPSADDQELSKTITAAVAWVKEHDYEDPIDALDRIRAQEATMDTRSQVITMPARIPDAQTAAITPSADNGLLALRIYKYTDTGNAERLVSRHREHIHYSHPQKTWSIYDGKRWAEDRRGQMMSFAKDIARELYAEASEIKDEGERKACAGWALKSESTERKKAMLVSAQSEKGIPILPEEFDCDPFLLNTLTGTVDLRSGDLRQHRREDLITKLAPVAYVPGARSALWERFLDEATGGNREMQDFLQRAAGYSLTGDVSEEKLFFLHGPGGSGKSTFLEAIKTTLGDYAKTADFETFVARNQAGGIRDDVAELAGRRFVVSIEVDEAKRLAEGLTKTLTGGDTVRARFLYQQSFEFLPQFKLWLAANHAPKVKHNDSAMWRRILRIPFQHELPKAKRDTSIKARLKDVHESGPAILAWAVEGCLRWREEGLGVPTVVDAATEQYRMDMDPLKDFLADCCVLSPTAWVTTKDLRQAYELYCKERGEKHLLNPNDFAAGLQDRECKPDRRHVGRCWIGIGLLATTGPEGHA